MSSLYTILVYHLPYSTKTGFIPTTIIKVELECHNLFRKGTGNIFASASLQ